MIRIPKIDFTSIGGLLQARLVGSRHRHFQFPDHPNHRFELYHLFLRNAASIPTVTTFWRVMPPGSISAFSCYSISSIVSHQCQILLTILPLQISLAITTMPRRTGISLSKAQYLALLALPPPPLQPLIINEFLSPPRWVLLNAWILPISLLSV